MLDELVSVLVEAAGVALVVVPLVEVDGVAALALAALITALPAAPAPNVPISNAGKITVFGLIPKSGV